MKKNFSMVLPICLLLTFSIFSAQKQGCLLYDTAYFLDPHEKKLIETKLLEIERNTTVEIAVYTVKSLKGKSLEYTSLELATQLGIGKSGVNNGVLILIVPNSKKIRIENGFGIEWVLNDKKSHEIIELIVPYFRNEKYCIGILKGIEFIQNEVSKYDWKINKITFEELANISKIHLGKVISFRYSNQTGKYKYKYPLPSDEQFNRDFYIDLYHGKNKMAKVFYTKYMGDSVNALLSRYSVTVFVRVVKLSPLEIQLVGVIN